MSRAVLLGPAVLLCALWVSVCPGSAVKLLQNGYRDVVVAIHPRVPEDPALLQSIQAMFTEASQYLFTATRRRAIFEDVKILVPMSWRENNTLYRRPNRERYTEASVWVSDPFCENAITPPFTSTLGHCGQQGRYIHFTPRYLLDHSATDTFGPRGRVLVRLWATLHWGVFSEFDSKTPFYRSFTGTIEATRCSSSISGSHLKSDGSACETDPQTGLPTGDCTFQPSSTQNTTGSIMYQPFIPQITEFCDSRSHNSEAPNTHNRLCDYRSVWDVISSTPDFLNGNNPPIATDPPPPSFTLLRAQRRVVCLVLDTSGSMIIADRITRLKQAAQLFLLQIVEQGSLVGIVDFDHESVILKSLTIIDMITRKELSATLPSEADGGTNICRGLRKGFEVLRGDDKQVAGDEIILLTDGQDSGLGSCMDEVAQSGAIVHTIALGHSTEPGLEQFALRTGGKQCFATDKLDSTGLMDIFSGISSGSGDDITTPIQLLSTGTKTAPGTQFSGSVSVDSTVGNNTVFTFTWQLAQPQFSVWSPRGDVYNNSHLDTDPAVRTARLTLPGVAKSGTWSFTVLNSYSFAQTFTVTVISQAVNECVPPVIVTGTIEKSEVTYPEPIIITATVSQGNSLITQANVTVIVDLDNGKLLRLPALDDGAGADEIRADGFYTCLFYDYSQDGRYSIKLEVLGEGGRVHVVSPKEHTAPTKPASAKGRVRRSVEFDQPNHKGPGDFSRSAMGGTVKVTRVPDVPQDNFPPSRVTDLTASLLDGSVLLQWTAPGDDYNMGTVSSYDVRMSPTPDALRDNFSQAYSLNTSSLSVVPAGQKQTLQLPLTMLPATNQSVLFFTLRASDDAKHTSPMSSIANFNFAREARKATVTTPSSAPILTLLSAAVNKPKSEVYLSRVSSLFFIRREIQRI
ncbi:calcium-activated chloride channel regulator 1 isoform X2 [Amia ocellicauda]|uniref:calcium-activated chloride channel regulator 1 isoform X2 n=1 Tax=Amia ocellicauda TaxID=2972642 RepID=UPI003464756F